MQPVYYIMPHVRFFSFLTRYRKKPRMVGNSGFFSVLRSFRTPVCSGKADRTAPDRIMFSTARNGQPENIGHKNPQKSLK